MKVLGWAVAGFVGIAVLAVLASGSEDEPDTLTRPLAAEASPATTTAAQDPGGRPETLDEVLPFLNDQPCSEWIADDFWFVDEYGDGYDWKAARDFDRDGRPCESRREEVGAERTGGSRPVAEPEPEPVAAEPAIDLGSAAPGIVRVVQCALGVDDDGIVGPTTEAAYAEHGPMTEAEAEAECDRRRSVATTQAEAAPVTTPARPVGILGNGTWLVGDQIEPGRHRFYTDLSCYWARLSGFGGTVDDIHANGNVSGQFIVDVLPSDTGFELVCHG